MSSLGKRLALLEGLQPHKQPRCICIKVTTGRQADVEAIMRSSGLEPHDADTVVIINKPVGTGGEDRVLSWEMLR